MDRETETDIVRGCDRERKRGREGGRREKGNEWMSKQGKGQAIERGSERGSEAGCRERKGGWEYAMVERMYRGWDGRTDKQKQEWEIINIIRFKVKIILLLWVLFGKYYREIIALGSFSWVYCVILIIGQSTNPLLIAQILILGCVFSLYCSNTFQRFEKRSYFFRHAGWR